MMQPCMHLVSPSQCSKFGTVKSCPRTCLYRRTAQLSLLDDTNLTSELDSWIHEHSEEYSMVCREFCRLGEEGNYISVRDIFSELRKTFRGRRKSNNERYAFNNNVTSSLSAHLCAKYPQYAHMVSHRGEWKKVDHNGAQ